MKDKLALGLNKRGYYIYGEGATKSTYNNNITLIDSNHITPQLINDADNGLTISSSGVPQWLTTVITPDIIRAVQRKLSYQEIATDYQYGDFADDIILFPKVNQTGEVSPYSGSSIPTGGQTSIVYNNEPRQLYRFQKTIDYSDLSEAVMSKAKIDFAGELRQTLIVDFQQTIQNIGFFGVAGQATYGILTQPDLPSAIPATATWTTATPNQIIADFQAMVIDMQDRMGAQANGQEKMYFVAQAGVITALKNASQNFLATSAGWLEVNYPQVQLVPSDQYSPSFNGGTGKAQLIMAEVNGKINVLNLFTYNYRSHGVVRLGLGCTETVTAGVGGAVIRFPMAVTTITGVAS